MAKTQQQWTRSSLETQILGELNQDRNAAGGSVPARMTSIVHESYEDLWDEHDWLFKRVHATLTLSADTATADLPDEFAKLDQKWLYENNRNGPLFFTDESHPFEDVRYTDSDITAYPELAKIRPKTSETTKFIWEVEVTPTPVAEMTYRYVYMREPPSIDDDTVILWPQPFHRGWHHLALARCQRAFLRDSNKWQESFAAYTHWLDRAKSQNDETLRESTPSIRDGNGYYDAVASASLVVNLS
jgi:hypothetical protein